jgi:hypothetical protein
MEGERDTAAAAADVDILAKEETLPEAEERPVTAEEETLPEAEERPAQEREADPARLHRISKFLPGIWTKGFRLRLKYGMRIHRRSASGRQMTAWRSSIWRIRSRRRLRLNPHA